VEPAEGLGHRLVLDLASGKTSTPAVANLPVQPVKITETGRVLVIAIDAGHGGQDPGASGRKGTREKDITLAIARKLKDRIDAEPGMRAFLTRDNDVFVPLRERIVRARKQQADIFVSVHADAVRDRNIAGSSVYVLSAGRATNEASRMLADRENAADLMGGMALENKDDVLASVLLDLSQGASMSASNEAADKVLAQLIRVGAVLDKEVKHASLKVLTSPDMPSMLVETAFISNPKEEAKLNDAAYQQRLADAILAGVRTYFYDNPPPGTQVAQRVAQLRDKHESAASMTIMAGGLAK
jgi:N-acetylmuramoyl-L-alanine amidase